MQYRENNTLEFLPAGHLSYDVRWRLLNDARDSIHIVTFSFMKDGTTKKLFALLKEKADAGVKIRIIYDEIVNRTTFVGGWIEELRQHGIEAFGYNGLMEGWQFDLKGGHPFKPMMMTAKLKLKQHFHEKYFIVDNHHLIIGGNNWGDKYAFGGIEPKAWRDSDVYLTGEIVRDVQLQFLKDYEKQKEWNLQKKNRDTNYTRFTLSYLPVYTNDRHVLDKYPDLLGHKHGHLIERPLKIAYMCHKPYDENELRLTNFFLEKIRGAKTRIYWGCHGIRPPKIFAEYLAEAVKRGVKVVLITNSKKSSKTLMAGGLLGWMYWECTKHFKFLVENGIEVYEWQKPGAFHSKNMIIDDDFVSIGSYNIANGSAFHHSESNVVIEDLEFCATVYNQFTIDLGFCKKVDSKTFPFPKENAFDRPIHERYKMIRKDLLPESIKKDLETGNFKNFPLYELLDIS